jgi:uncharacterized membrane protein YdbT with pleckstrin-like domain
MKSHAGQVKPNTKLDILARSSPFFLFLRILTVHAIVAVVILLIVFTPRLFIRTVADIEILYNLKIVTMLTVLLIGEVITLMVIARWVTEFYIIKNDSLTYRVGIFFKQKRVLLIRQIVEVELIQNFFARLFQYGTIKVITAQALEGVYIKRVSNPNKYFKILRELSVNQQERHERERASVTVATTSVAGTETA